MNIIMSEMSGVPVALSYSLNRINNVSVNTFQIASTTASDVSPNSQIRFLLPTAGMLDFKTLRLNFAVELTEGAGNGGARLPAGIKHLFQRVQVMVGGVVIAQGTNFFGVQEDALSIVENNPADDITEHGSMCLLYDMAGGPIHGAVGQSELYATGLGSTSTLFSCDLGDIAKISPRIVPLDLMSQVEIIFYTNSTSVLSAVKGTVLSGGAGNDFTKSNANTSPSYTIKRATLNANMYSLDDGAFSMAVASRIRDVGFAEL
jgi:hypothetical protein